MLKSLTFCLIFIALAYQISAHTDTGVRSSFVPSAAPVLDLSFFTVSGLNYLSEGCNNTDATLRIKLSEPFTTPMKFIVTLSGTATLSDDYTVSFQDTIELPAGQTELVGTIQVLTDTLAEGSEDVQVTITSLDGQITGSTSISIFDGLNVSIVQGDSVYICGGKGTELSATGATSYSWSPTASFTSDTGAVVSYIANDTALIYVTGTSGGCTGIDSIYVRRTSPTIELKASAGKLCGPSSLNLDAVVNHEGGTYSWSPANLFAQQNVSRQFITLRKSAIIKVTYTYDGCETSDTVHVDVVEGLDYTPPFTDTTLCQDQQIAFGDFTDAPDYYFEPTTDIDFSDPNNPIARPKATTTYQVFLTGVDTTCKRNYKFEVRVEQVTFKLISSDSVNLCKADSTAIRFEVSPPNTTVVYDPADSTIRRASALEYWVKPSVSTTYHFTATGPLGCVVNYEVKIRVDSIPELPITNWNPKDKYCAGDSILLTSPEVSKAKYPDVQFNWESIGEQNSKADLNLLIIAQDTFLYIRKTTNVACYRADSIKLNVVQPKILLSLNDTTVCADRPVSVEVKGDVTDIKWDPTDGVNCSNNCYSAVIKNSKTQQYKVEGKKDGCPAVTFFNYNVQGSYWLVIEASPGTNIAKGTQVTLTITNSLPNVTDYEWKYNGKSLSQKGKSITVIIEEDINNFEASIGPDPTGIHCGAAGTIYIQGVVPYIKMPNAFTPNSDSKNDVFQAVVPDGVEVTNMVIVNRWGQTIFEGSDNTGWNGKYKEKDSPSDTYLYRVKYKFATGGTEQVTKGEVNLLR
ncbi:MAG TPA: gliding motility-associated C-terminal domain-containing protein [Saprospiraceae bacterium]|nr:gliding motility-associated C-terminal domain-containing protein [Saprospiraceae bacterium]